MAPQVVKFSEKEDRIVVEGLGRKEGVLLSGFRRWVERYTLNRSQLCDVLLSMPLTVHLKLTNVCMHMRVRVHACFKFKANMCYCLKSLYSGSI